MAFTWLSEDEIAEFLINTERKESKITQNLLLDGCYDVMVCARKKTVFIS